MRVRRWNSRISSSRFRNSGRKCGPYYFHHLAAYARAVLALGLASENVATQIGSQNDQRVAESTRAARAVGQAAVIEDLQQYVEDVGMRLLHLVEEDHLIGPPAHDFGQRSALLISHIAGRCSDHPGATERCSRYSGHVDAGQRRIASNRKEARALASSVLPTPVGPRSRNEPIGRFGSAGRRAHGAPHWRSRRSPRLGRRHAGAALLPYTSSFSRSPSSIRSTGMPVQRETTAATSFSPTTVVQHRRRCSPASAVSIFC